jgi:hypothetical protein
MRRESVLSGHCSQRAKPPTGCRTTGLAELLYVLRRVIGNLEGVDWSGEPGRAYGELEQWNDEPGRTYADIVAVLSAAEVVACTDTPRVTPAMHAGVADHVGVESRDIVAEGVAKMTENITVSREQAGEIFKALNGIGKLLKMLPSKPENAAVMYAIMSNLTVIQMNLTAKQVSN